MAASIVRSSAFGAAASRGGSQAVDRNAESGQSLMEFMLMLPALFGLTVIMLRVNQAIQLSIVGQQYLRSHVLWLAFNSPIYPEYKYRQEDLTTKGSNQMTLGLASNSFASDADQSPIAMTQRIVRNGVNAPKSQPGDDSSTDLGIVKIATTASLCTQSNVIRGASGGLSPFSSAALAESTTAQSFMFCSSPYQELEPFR